MSIYNADLGIAGTLDAIATLKNGERTLIDFKSSKGFYDGYDMQIYAYRYMAEQKGEVLNGQGILRLDKATGEPEYKAYKNKNYERKLKAFMALVDFYYLIKNRRLKNNKRVEENKKWQ